MVQRIVPQKVQVVSRDGEVEVAISIELNINLTTDNLTVTAQAIPEQKVTKPAEKKVDDFFIPQFGNEKIVFGKKEDL